MYTTVLLGALTEFGPLAAFFVVGNLFGFLSGVTGLLVVTVLMVFISRLSLGKLPYFALLSALFVVVESALVLWFQEPLILIATDTLFYCCITFTFAVAWLQQRHLLEFFFGHLFALQSAGWSILTRRWTLFFLVVSLTNIAAALLLTPEEWINYRTGRSVVIAVFILCQFRLAMHYRLPDRSDRWGLRLDKKPQP